MNFSVKWLRSDFPFSSICKIVIQQIILLKEVKLWQPLVNLCEYVCVISPHIADKAVYAMNETRE